MTCISTTSTDPLTHAGKALKHRHRCTPVGQDGSSRGCETLEGGQRDLNLKFSIEACVLHKTFSTHAQPMQPA